MEVLGIRSARTWKVLSLSSLAVLLTVLAVGCGDTSSPGLSGITRDPPAKTDGVTLPDESPGSKGREIALKGNGGGLMLVYFGYTSCPDVCPTSMADLRLALADLDPEQREKVQVSMVTVDPKRDSGKILNGYLGHFFEKGEFHSLRTTRPAQLARAEKVFGASHKLGKPDAEGEYDVSHTAQIFAVDDRGIVRVEWPFQTDPELISRDLETLLQDNSEPDA